MRSSPAESDSDRRSVKSIDGKWWILLSVGVGTFMSALDGSVANIVVPVLENTFKSDVATVEWVVTIYLLVVSGVLLSFGRLGDLHGHKSIYNLGFIIFVVGSAFSGLSPNVHILIIWRAIQALGAAMLFANSPAILTSNFPAAQRGQALGLQAMMTYLGLTVGPSLGGWLTDLFSWRAVFFINVPIGILALLLSLHFIPADKSDKSPEPFDLPGAAIFLGGLVALLFALNQGETWGWLSPPILGLFALALFLLAVFVIIESRIRSPILDLSLFRSHLFTTATASAVINYLCLYSIVFLMPFYLIQGRSFTPGEAGLILTAQPLVMAISAPLSGTLSDRIGSQFLSTLGMAIMAVGLYLVSHLNLASPTWLLLLSLAIFGLGTGIFISPNTNALMGSAPKNRQGIASGVLATARNSGMVLGVGLAGALFTTFQSISPVSDPHTALIYGIHWSFLVSTGVAIFGILVSASRGSHKPG
ncbi:MAG: MFS transporter [Chloroflexi bacterium]|nr:MFS transporter [Chloroflexota bacterium]